VYAAGVFVWLGSWRLLPRRMQARPLLFLALAVGAALATAGIETLWYLLATGVPALRVLEANAQILPWPRPAVWVAIVFAAVALVGTVRRWKRRVRPAPIAA
jgi:sulfoxide reductase heme-binding subunit YedZ